MKKVLRFFWSMQFALILLVILAAVCSMGSFITQGQTLEWYAQQYSEGTAQMIMRLGLNDVFHCTWFLALTVVLCLNLLGCNIIHFPKLIRRMKGGFCAEKILKGPLPEAVTVTDSPQEFMRKLGFRRITEGTDRDGSRAFYAVKNKIGIWGAWLCHLGMLTVIIGFGLGQMLKVEYTVYGVKGQTKPVGDTAMDLTIDDFTVALREDDTVEQYTSVLTLTDRETGESLSGSVCVNQPLSLFGLKMYQNSTGWAATVDVAKDGKVIQEEILCAGEYLEVQDKPGLNVVFAAFYPDYTTDAAGQPMTASGKLNAPAYLYRLFYQNEVVGMNVLTGNEMITVDEYEIIFREPRSYTLIQIKRDRFQWLAAIGGLMILIALVLAFYVRTAEIWAVEQEDGMWEIGGRSRKGGIEYIENIKALGGKMQ